MIFHAFGDTGGHFQNLYEGLLEIGMTRSYKLPDDIIVIHCGDLIHKGPQSNEVVEMVDTIMRKNPGQWKQLAGNHETNYLGGTSFWHDRKVSHQTKDTLQEWHANGDLLWGYGIPAGATIHSLVVSARGYKTPNKPMLFTHAGLTAQFWERFLGGEKDIEKLVSALNNLPLRLVDISGNILMDKPSYMEGLPPGPIWASSVSEVWASWAPYYETDHVDTPFIQVHGHTSGYDHDRNQWYPGTYLRFREASRVNPKRRTLVTEVNDSIHVAVDPFYSNQAPAHFQPALRITTP